MEVEESEEGWGSLEEGVESVLEEACNVHVHVHVTVVNY